MESPPLAPLPDGFADTVAALHLVAERIVAPARKPDNEIALEATAGGFGTPPFAWEGAEQTVRVAGIELVRCVDGVERRVPLSSLAAAAGLVADLLRSDPKLGERPLAPDPQSARLIAAWFQLGADELRALAAEAGPGDAATAPVLWPEHFDLAIELGPEDDGGRANYGLSPGDEQHPEPYLYVGPWSAEVEGELWNASGFAGAELSYRELLRAGDPRRAAHDFFSSRRDALATTRR